VSQPSDPVSDLTTRCYWLPRMSDSRDAIIIAMILAKVGAAPGAPTTVITSPAPSIRIKSTNAVPGPAPPEPKNAHIVHMKALRHRS